MKDEIEFRRFTHADLPLVHRWLNAEHVARWFDVDGVFYPSYERVAEKYGRYAGGEAPVDPYVIVCDGAPIGYIQTYLVDDYPDYARAVGVGPGAAGVDMLVGERGYAYRGLGSRALRLFLERIVFARAEAERCIIGPDPGNAAAIRAYEKAGFRYLRRADIPGGHPPREYVMMIERAAQKTGTAA